MAAAILLGLATIATMAAISSGQMAVNVAQCPPCNKMMEVVCAKDKEGNLKTFTNPCLIGFCNCVLNLTKVDRVFEQTYEGQCKGTETTIPQCFQEGSSTMTPPGGNVTGVTPVPTLTPTAGGRNINTTTETPSGASSVLKTILLTIALPLATIPIFL